MYSIIVTYNGMQWIRQCIDSLLTSSHLTIILVIDNGSTDETVPFLRATYPQVYVHVTGKNLGFGQANNIGIRKALQEGAEHIFLLNQDAWVEPETIAKLVLAQQQHPNIGIASPVHLNGTGSAPDLYFLQYVRESTDQVTESSLLDRKVTQQLIPCAFINAAAWLLSRECLLKVGGFDRIFFHYGEDRNYCQRVRYHGFDIAVVTGSFIYHDREQRLQQTSTDNKAQLKMDWMHYLVDACDVSHTGHKRIIAHRLGRYTLASLRSFLNFNGGRIKRNITLVKKILFSIDAVGKSRRESMQTDKTPHL